MNILDTFIFENRSNTPVYRDRSLEQNLAELMGYSTRPMLCTVIIQQLQGDEMAFPKDDNTWDRLHSCSLQFKRGHLQEVWKHLPEGSTNLF